MFKMTQERKSPIANQDGMSLIEILIVITLMAVAGSFVMTKVFDRMQEGYQQAAKTQINAFKSDLENFRRYCNQYPTSEQGLEALFVKSTSAPECPNYPASGIMEGGKPPLDPWGRPYVYESPDSGKTYVVTSYGRDGKESGDPNSPDKDIKSND
jgi:general secretion pathway protein G